MMARLRLTRTYSDDAVASLSVDEPMEGISHRELERILRGELAVAEFRIAAKIAKFHKSESYSYSELLS